jgi:2-succinyl-6-hydroxy-2,4-cyclohexadiene-1-carboxylate synthase
LLNSSQTKSTEANDDPICTQRHFKGRLRVNNVPALFNPASTDSLPALVLLHGFTGSPHSWNAIVPDLEKHYHVIRPYLPGHQPQDADCPTFEVASAQVADLLANFPAPRTLLGYSLGGRLALYTALQHPHCVDQLILESATPGIEDEGERAARKQADDQLAQDIRAKGMRWFVDYWANLPLFASQQRLPASVRAAQQRERLAHHPEGLAQSLERMGTGVMPPMWARLDALRCPVHLITGALDARYSAIATRMASLLPQVRRSEITEAGHTPHLEAPSQFLTALLR